MGLLLHSKAPFSTLRNLTCSTFSLSRWYAAAAAAAEDQAIARATRPGQPPPLLLPFAVTPAEALAAFKRYQAANCFNLHASNLLGSDHTLRPLFMPFWLFEATVSSEARGVLGRRVDRSGSRSSPLVWSEMADWHPITSHMKLPSSLLCMQVCASYALRRDLAEAAKPQALDLSAAAITLSHQELQQRQHPDRVAAVAAAAAGVGQRSGTGGSDSSSSSSSGGSSSSSSSSSSSGGSSSSSGGGSSASSTTSSSSASSSGGEQVPLQVPLMRQAIAWQLCHRQVMHEQIQAAAEKLKQDLSADEVRDLQVRLHVHSRTARLVFCPAYHLHYVHGEKYTPSRADIVPALYDALIGAAGRPPRISAELHPSPLKSQAAAAAAVTGLGLGVMPLTSLALGFDPTLLSVAGADAALLAVLAASGAGAIASQLPLIARNRHAAAQAEADRRFYKQYDQREAAHGAPPDEHTLWLWRDADWRKWERDEPWSWDADKRRAQAEDLYRQQMQRDIDRMLAQKQREEASRKREEDEAREAKRERRYGRQRGSSSSSSSSSSSHFQEEAGARRSHGVHHGAHRRRRDFLGYYKALGINLEEAGTTISGDFIKMQYKAAVMKLHPDRHVHTDEATQQRVAERFRRLQVAYEVLRDAEKRRAYDQGRLVQ